MKRVFNFLQWLGFAALVAAILWLVFRPSPPLDYRPDTWSSWDGFMTISYAGVTRSENTIYPSSRTLLEHMEALRASGYQTITPEDALAFLEGRAPLPDKALLILFEGARKETFVRAHPVLRKFGMRATLCVPTVSIESWDESCLRTGDIRKILAMPQWGIASMGGKAMVLHETADGRQDHFLSTRQWIPRERRLETDEEFRARLKKDYTDSAAVLAKLNGAPVTAFVYPYADDGRRTGADPLAGEFNYAGVTANHRMAFVLASNPFNPPGRHPYALTRLRVNGDWTAAQVLTALKRARPLADRVVEIGSSEQWALAGSARIVRDELILGDEDAARIRGSDLWTDAQITVSIKRTPKTIAVCYARMLSPADCLRLSIDDKDIRLQESRSGMPVTIRTAPTPAGDVLRLDWKVKGLRSWLVVNDLPVFGPVPLATPSASGAIGFESQGGVTALAQLKVQPLQRRGVLAESWMGLPFERRASITDYLTPFPEPGEAVPAQQCLDSIQAVSEGAEVWPILRAPTNGVEPAARTEAMVAQLARQDIKPFIRGFVVDAAHKDWIAPLRAGGFRIMHRVQAGEAMPLSVTNETDHVWLDMTGADVYRLAREFLRRHPPSQLVLRDEEAIRRIPRVDQIVVWTEGEGKNP